MSAIVLDQIRDLSKALSPQDKLRLINVLVHQLLHEPSPPPKKPFRSLRGALADLGPGPSAEDIDEMRREVWANFPRDDY